MRQAYSNPTQHRYTVVTVARWAGVGSSAPANLSEFVGEVPEFPLVRPQGGGPASERGLERVGCGRNKRPKASLCQHRAPTLKEDLEAADLL